MTGIANMVTFYRDNGLDHWASQLSGLTLPERPPGEGFQAVAVLPPLKLQRQDTAVLLDTMTRPHRGLDAAQQYGGYWIQSIEALQECQMIDRPEGVAYAVWIQEGSFPEETTNQTCSKLVKGFAEKGWTGLTVHEFLVIQRRKAIENGDHRWSSYYATELHPAGHQWLPNARTGKKVFQGYWVQKGGQVQIGACATGSKKASRGAYPCVITPLNGSAK
jgi:hypothetical protein